MKGDVYYGKGIRELEGEYPDLYELVSDLNSTVWEGKVIDYKTQKLIAIGITASRADPRATKKQMRSAIEVLGITKDEIGCLKSCSFNFRNACIFQITSNLKQCCRSYRRGKRR